MTPNVVKDVWSTNLYEEFKKIREMVDKYPYIAMDTEFPGVVARPVVTSLLHFNPGKNTSSNINKGQFKNSSDYHYQTLRCNVDLLKIIQLGLTFADENGKLPLGICTWQFHFKFNLSDDMYAQDSIDLLQKSGIDFTKHQEYGIDVEQFGDLLTSSGLVLFENIKWISFHRFDFNDIAYESGYDFGYLLKVLTCDSLPAEETDFFDYLRIFFPSIYDIKFLMKSCKNLKGGLQDVADELKIARIGPQHQAGSDSLLTSQTFFKLRHNFFNDEIDDEKFMGCLYGLSTQGNHSTLSFINKSSE